MTENLSYQSFSAISLDRATKSLCRRDAKSSHRRLVGPNEQCVVATVESRAILVNLLKIGVAADPLGRPECLGLNLNTPIRC
jgi:hypothetical protein